MVNEDDLALILNLMQGGDDNTLSDVAAAADASRAELGAVMERSGLSNAAINDVLLSANKAIETRAALAHEAFNAGVEQLDAAWQLQANGGFTLVGPSGVGFLYAPGATIFLAPAQGGAVLTVPYGLNTDVLVVEMVVRKADVDAGWMMVGGSLKWSTDPYSGIPNDLSLVAWQSEGTNSRPLSSIFTIQGPHVPGSPITLQAAVINHGPAAVPFGGLTFTIRDNRCNPAANNPALRPRMLRLIQSAAAGKLIPAILERMRAGQSPKIIGANKPNILKALTGALALR